MNNRLSMVLAISIALVIALTVVTTAAGTPAGTIITNSAYLAYSDANGNPMTTIESNAVTTEVIQVAGVDISPKGVNTAAVSGEVLYVPFNVYNTGNGTDTMTLSVVSVPPTYAATIYSDDNGNGMLDPDETTVLSDTGSLAADAYRSVLIKITVPADAMDGDIATVTLKATSTFNSLVFDEQTITITINQAHLVFTKHASNASPKPGDEITYTITFTNDGNDTARSLVITDHIEADVTYVIGSITLNSAGLTDAHGDDAADFGHTTPDAVTVNVGDLAPEASGTITFRVRVKDHIPAGTVITNIAHATYKDATDRDLYVDTPPAISTTAVKAGVELSVPVAAFDVTPGGTVTVPFTVKNTGNAGDVIDLVTTSSLFSWAIWLDLDGNEIIDNGDLPIIDTDGDGKLDTGTLPMGGLHHFLAVATVPAGTPDLAADTLIINAISSNDDTVHDSKSVLVTVHAPKLTITKSVSPTGPQAPGQVLTYTIVVQNIGSGMAKNISVTDAIPTHTTYVPESILINGVARTDATDGDGGHFSGGAVYATWNQLMSDATLTVVFQVKID